MANTLTVMTAAFALSCGGGARDGSVEGALVNTINGRTNVHTSGKFIYQFDHETAAYTVNENMFFIRQTPHRDIATAETSFDEVVCSNSQALLGRISCEFDTCVLLLDSPLESAETYTTCLLPGIEFEDGRRLFGGFMATFATRSKSTRVGSGKREGL